MAPLPVATTSIIFRNRKPQATLPFPSQITFTAPSSNHSYSPSGSVTGSNIDKHATSFLSNGIILIIILIINIRSYRRRNNSPNSEVSSLDNRYGITEPVSTSVGQKNGAVRMVIATKRMLGYETAEHDSAEYELQDYVVKTPVVPEAVVGDTALDQDQDGINAIDIEDGEVEELGGEKCAQEVINAIDIEDGEVEEPDWERYAQEVINAMNPEEIEVEDPDEEEYEIVYPEQEEALQDDDWVLLL